MAHHDVRCTWDEGLVFTAHQDDREFMLAGSADESGVRRGVSPKKLLLTALAGCTAMDVASLLPKMRVPFSHIHISASGELTEEHPKVYLSMHVVYDIGTTEEYRSQVESIVEKSVTKYCGVHAMLEKVASVTHEIRLTGSVAV
ncbi:MAG: OsmC family protein [Candidatus Kapabacteria bacterium]|jgi:putative redox protein|nr:OsmC family protein [Candidatus Kapabacteria bacterium]